MDSLNDGLVLAAVFGGMLFLVWILPGVVVRKGKFPEDIAPQKRA